MEDEDMGENDLEQDDEEDGEEKDDRRSDVEENDARLAGFFSKLSGRSIGATSAHAERDSDDEDEEEKSKPELGRHHKHHHKKHHKKHKHKKKHQRDRQQCRYLEGLSRSVVKFGTSSGDYLAVSHGNNTCYQAVRGLS